MSIYPHIAIERGNVLKEMDILMEENSEILFPHFPYVQIGLSRHIQNEIRALIVTKFFNHTFLSFCHLTLTIHQILKQFWIYPHSRY